MSRETRRLTRRASLLTLGGVAGSLALAACGEPVVRYVGKPQAGPPGPAGPQGAKGAAGAKGPAGAPGAAGKTPVVVAYYSNLSATHPESIARAANFKEFNETVGKQLNIVVDLSNAEAGAGGNAKGGTSTTKIKTLAAGGTPPDLYYTAYRLSQEFYVAGMTIDVDTELKGVKGWSDQRADIFPHIFVSSTWVGKLVGVPGYTNDVAFIYNKGLLQQGGVAPPQQGWTWDDFETKASKFVRPPRENPLEGLIPLSMGWYFWIGFLRTTGSLPISRDATKITVDTPEFLEVMERWLRWLKQRIIFDHPNPKQTWGVREEYRNAKNNVVFEMQGPYRIPTIRKAKAPDFGVIHTPNHPTKRMITTYNGGHNLVIFKQIPAKRRHAAARVAMWMNGPKAQTQMVIRATSVPVNKAVMTSKELNDYLKTDPQLKGFVDLAPVGWRWPGLPSYSKINGAIGQAVKDIMKQKIGPKAGLEKAQREAQTFLDKDVALMQKK